MNDLDVIAYLFPADGLSIKQAKTAIYMEENNDRSVPRQRKDELQPNPNYGPDRFVRAPTEQPDERDDNKTQENRPCLILRFSQPPKTKKGLVA